MLPTERSIRLQFFAALVQNGYEQSKHASVSIHVFGLHIDSWDLFSFAPGFDLVWAFVIGHVVFHQWVSLLLAVPLCGSPASSSSSH